eukprot:3667514-Pleurochrysis_carterae.AAC.1
MKLLSAAHSWPGPWHEAQHRPLPTSWQPQLSTQDFPHALQLTAIMSTEAFEQQTSEGRGTPVCCR